LLSNFAAELCNYHKQTKLFNKKRTRGNASATASPKKATIYEEKKKKEKKIRENTPS